MELAKKKCQPCEGGVPPLGPERVESLLTELKGWKVESGKRELHKRFEFGNFRENMKFVARVADLAEAEGHHPDFCVHYSVLDVTLTTHAVGGLSDNDFILAAKIDALGPTTSP